MSEATRDSYDAVAAVYAAKLSDELAGKPMDRAWLAAIARRSKGLLGDLGCGPGHVTAFLADAGADVVGLDLSPGMVAQARRAHPALRFEVADILALGAAPGRFAGLVAMYSLIHFDAAELAAALRACHAALRPGGELCAAVHLGEGVLRPEALWEVPVRLDFHLFGLGALERAMTAAGFAVVESRARPPFPAGEYPSHRAYVRGVRSRF